ncbi:protein transport protein Sec31A isoform X2 [Atheta coriaria]|uniref:protein transport protein Sec31A isoform X2 n=1 Tax=Dalotia coriaria TaxID=877792 RepID=UPI0031F43145
MKVKDLERTANIAWSPANVSPIYLAAGTAGQQLDASFETNASLEIFALNLDEPGTEVETKASTISEHRFHKLAWSNYGSDAGTIVGGCDAGIMQIYNANKMLQGEPGLVSKQDKHTGAVHSIDFNPFQNYLLASGSVSSEIFIWDLNNLSAPMTPGAKSQPFEDVLSIQWNRQVQHILASTFSSKCVVWDLRKNETIIKLTDTVSRIRWKVVAWHPEVATQLCLASEEDQAPVIQLWDLRFATSPLKTLENHQRGVLSMAWCAQDPDLLVSGGKDNRLLCWNPNSNQQGGEILSEVGTTNQWSFDIAWCPKNPALIATPCFDGHVSVYSLLGGKAQQIQTTNKIADSFPGMDAGDYVQAPVQQPTANLSVDLSKAPKWLKKPVGASFGFGGKLISFDHDKSTPSQQAAVNGQAPLVPRQVYISQVVTESELVRKSTELEQALEYGNFTDYCRNKADASIDQHTRYVWHFLKANFEPNPRTEFLNLLGYKIEDVNAKLAPHMLPKEEDALNQLNQQFMTANRIDTNDGFDQIRTQQQQSEPKVLKPYRIHTGDDSDGLIAQALLLNNVEAAADLCIKAKRYADAIIIAMTGGPELCARTQAKYLEQCEGYVSSLISALIREDWVSVINNCEIESWREALAASLTHSSDDDLPVLCEMMGTRLEQESSARSNTKLLQEAQLCYICAGSFDKLVTSWTTNANSSNDDLQDLVELVTFLQKSVERQGKQVHVTGRLADLLSNYALILASQGNLSTALSYLGSSKDPNVADLRERLYIALGHKPAAYAPVQPRSRQNTHRSSITSAFRPAVVPNAVPPVTQPWQQQATNAQPGWQAQGLSQTQSAAAPWQQPPAQPWQNPINSFNQSPPSPGPPILPPMNAQPPRPISVGPTGLPKNKYVVDPSVQSGGYGSPMRNNSFNNGSTYGTPSFQPPMIPAPQVSMMSPSPNMMMPQPQATPYATPFVPQPTPQPEMPMPPTSSAMNALPPTAAPGWNDPPVLHKAAKQSLAKPEVPQNPITHPIFGTAPVTPLQPTSNGYMDPTQPPAPTQAYNPYMSQPSVPMMPQPGMEPNMFQPQTHPQQFGNFNTQPIMHSQLAQQPAKVETAPQEAAEPVPKPPIPEEHIHMQTVFDELRMQCGRAANNPQTKRKIEDVGRKLDTLYDLLREHKLSANALAGLHQMVQQIQHGDYPGGLAMHTQLVSGPDFAQIAAFMPGLKVLLQCALQLQVYLR